jgi:hypothetical protein
MLLQQESADKSILVTNELLKPEKKLWQFITRKYFQQIKKHYA